MKPGMLLAALVLAASLNLSAADTAVVIKLDVSKAGPRAVESLTEQRIVRDYKFAWTSLSQALEVNATDPLDGPFVGSAKQWLVQSVESQRQSNLNSRRGNQNHKLEAVFYAPEGDVIELHDTVEYQLQIFDGGKQIQDEHVTEHYVVLMTPGADRWVVRQLQAVAQF
jgi:hypothetical protein